MTSQEFSKSVGIVIATMNRDDDLIRCLDSIKNQTVLPAKIIIVDDGEINFKKIQSSIPERVAFMYHKKDKPGLSASRNIGARLAKTDLILFLDDDVVLEPDYIENILRVFKEDVHREVGGVCGIIANRKKKPELFKHWARIFLLDLGKPAAILPWGFYTMVDHIDRVIDADWISGGLSCFRREVFDKFQLYDFKGPGQKGGRHGLADIEFSLRVSQKYRLKVTPFARLHHYPSESSREKAYLTGYKHAYNQGVIFQKYCRKSLLNRFCFTWAMCGLILGNLGAVFLVRDKLERFKRLNMALGNLVGIFNFVLKT